MLRTAISSTEAKPTAQAMATALISTSSTSRALAVSFLESSIPLGSLREGRITAAAETGPAHGPRPASSTPQTGPAPQSFSSVRLGPIGFGLGGLFLRRPAHAGT